MASQSELIALLPTTPYLLIYSLPLLLFSLVFTFTGTFLTLDRTRTFPSRGTGSVYTSLPIPGSSNTFKKRKLNWVLEGGVGGLIGGYLFGVHLSTALSLLIPATTPSAALSYKSFLAVWVLSVVPTMALAARYRYVAYAFFAVSSGAFTSLAICVVIHPSLPPRMILTISFLVLFFVVGSTFAKIPRLHDRVFHGFLRICTASTGSFGLVQSIALLLNPPELSWANVWERLWIRDGVNWGTTGERGLSAAYWIFFLLGIIGDWALHKWIGECPDEKWDDYLAHYASNLSNQPDRAGIFQPFNSFWDKWFHSNSPLTKSPFELSSSNDQRDAKGVYSPTDVDLKAHLALPLAVNGVAVGKLSKKDRLRDKEEETLSPLSGGFRRKQKRRGGLGKLDPTATRARKPIKFGSDLSSESDSQDDDEPTKKGAQSSKDESISSTPTIPQQDRTLADPPPQPTLPPARTFSSSAPTLVERGKTTKQIANPLGTLDYEREIEAVKDNLRRNGAGGVDSEVEYSDYEEDAASTKDRSGNSFTPDRDGERWSPAFLARHQTQRAQPLPLGPLAQIHPGAIPVPATPSLIKAIDRIAVAQKDAFGISGSPVSMTAPAKPQPVSQPREEAEPDVGTAANQVQRSPRWEDFWREVRAKAQS